MDPLMRNLSGHERPHVMKAFGGELLATCFAYLVQCGQTTDVLYFELSPAFG
jgi:hypothetical protein